jgi:hypothetical protein
MFKAVSSMVKVKITRQEASRISYESWNLDAPSFYIIEGEVVKDKPWYFNSKSEIVKCNDIKSGKHQKRIEFGNAFETAEQASQARDAIKAQLKSIK